MAQQFQKIFFSLSPDIRIFTINHKKGSYHNHILGNYYKHNKQFLSDMHLESKV